MVEQPMDAETAAKVERTRKHLLDSGVAVVQPPNPYCMAAVLAGTRCEPEIIVNFWKGEPESVEFLRAKYPLKMLARAREALAGAARIIDEFPV